MTFKKYVKQIYLDALISNKLRNTDHFGLVCIIWNYVQCGWAAANHNPARGQMNESWRQYYTTIGRYSTVSSNHIILEVTMCLFSDGEHLSCPVIRPTNFTNPGINRNNGHYTVATRISWINYGEILYSSDSQYSHCDGSRILSKVAAQCILSLEISVATVEL